MKSFIHGRVFLVVVKSSLCLYDVYRYERGRSRPSHDVLLILVSCETIKKKSALAECCFTTDKSLISAMSPLVTLRSLAKAFGAQKLFTDLSLVIDGGDRIGLIGPNGSGKSTLLNIISGREDEDSGEISRRRNMVISYLAQEDELDEGLTGLDNLLQVLEKMPLEPAQRHNRAEAMLSPEPPRTRRPGGRPAQLSSS